MSKLKKIITILVVCILLLLITIYNAIYVNTKDITVRKETLSSEKIDNTLNNLLVCYFSDLHYGTFLDDEDLNNIETKINEFNPDIIIFGGDLIDSALSGDKQTKLNNFLRNLNCKYGKYAVLGDKDYEYLSQVTTIYQECDFRLLDNAFERIYINGSYINIVGINCNNPNYTSAYEGQNTSYYTIAVSHYPDLAANLSSANTDYILAGHSLGGQVYLPIISLFNRPTGAENYFKGKTKVNSITLDITNGLGTIKNDARLNADAEIVIYKFKSN